MADARDSVDSSTRQPLRVAVLQRVVPSYRTALFRHLEGLTDLRLRVFLGEDLPESKVRSAPQLEGFEATRLPTAFFRVGRRTLVWHRGLLRSLMKFRPDVIVAEGESNVLTYLKALFYRKLFRDSRLIHWSLGGLPGNELRYAGAKGCVVRALRQQADAFLVYSSYGKQVLEANGVSPDLIDVATNVADLSRHLALADSMPADNCRRLLGLGDEFVVLYVGAVTANKRLDVLVDAVMSLPFSSVRCFIVGDGAAREALECRSGDSAGARVVFTGRVDDGLAAYYGAADVFVLPGRGGMVISEAMAYALPVVVFQADGTEFDLIADGETGIFLRHGNAAELSDVLDRLAADRDRLASMGASARKRVESGFGTARMARDVANAIRRAAARRPSDSGTG